MVTAEDIIRLTLISIDMGACLGTYSFIVEIIEKDGISGSKLEMEHSVQVAA